MDMHLFICQLRLMRVKHISDEDMFISNKMLIFTKSPLLNLYYKSISESEISDSFLIIVSTSYLIVQRLIDILLFNP